MWIPVQAINWVSVLQGTARASLLFLAVTLFLEQTGYGESLLGEDNTSPVQHCRRHEALSPLSIRMESVKRRKLPQFIRALALQSEPKPLKKNSHWFRLTLKQQGPEPISLLHLDVLNGLSAEGHSEPEGRNTQAVNFLSIAHFGNHLPDLTSEWEKPSHEHREGPGNPTLQPGDTATFWARVPRQDVPKVKILYKTMGSQTLHCITD